MFRRKNSNFIKTFGEFLDSVSNVLNSHLSTTRNKRVAYLQNVVLQNSVFVFGQQFAHLTKI